MAVQAAAHVRRFKLTPKIALVSHSDFGSYDSPSSRKMRHACELLVAQHPELEVEGEMHGDSALSPAHRERVFPHSRLKREANVLIMPNLDAANIAYQMVKLVVDALPVGAAGPHPDAVGHRARRGQHDGGCRGAGGARGGDAEVAVSVRPRH
jgi:malate dehydrogenase (oxaloacetate-decarboxylating)(NADP+)